MPVEYVSAVRSLVACTTIDEAKYYSDKADALAAWAKIYKSDEARIAAKRLKLHAYRRMGILAGELRPTTTGVVDNGRGGKLKPRQPGPRSLIKEFGFGESDAAIIRKLGRMDEEHFSIALESSRPPTPAKLATSYRKGASQAYVEWVGGRMVGAVYFARTHSAKEYALQFAPDERMQVAAIVREISEWLDQFERYLPKEIRQ